MLLHSILGLQDGSYGYSLEMHQSWKMMVAFLPERLQIKLMILYLN